MNSYLTDEQKDAMKEIVSIGAGNAATALSQMLSKRVTIKVPNVNLVTLESAAEVFGSAETLVIAIYLQLLGDASGVILLSFNKDEAARIIGILLGKKPDQKSNILSEMAQSALKETATILSGAYLGAMGKLLKMRFLVSSPALAQDMAGAILNNILIEVAKEADHAIIAASELNIVDEKIMSYFFFVPDIKSLKQILKKIGMGA